MGNGCYLSLSKEDKLFYDRNLTLVNGVTFFFLGGGVITL